MIRIALLALLFYFLYRFVVRFLIPVLRVTSAARRQMNNMRQQEQSNASGPVARKPKQGEYIEFEELKQ